jgi:hypothetical protein
MMRYGRLVMLVAVAVAASACGSLGTGQLATIISNFSDGIGDTAGGAPPTVYDITQVVTRRIDNAPHGSYDMLQVEIGFLQLVLLSPPGSSGDVAGTQLQFGLIFNTDQNNSTGGTWGCDALGIYSGVEYFVDSTFISGRLFDGSYAIRQNVSGFPLTGEASVSTAGTTLTVQVPLAALGNDDGATFMGVWAGNRNGGTPNTTDCAPTPSSYIVTRESTRTPFSGPRPAP